MTRWAGWRLRTDSLMHTWRRQPPSSGSHMKPRSGLTLAIGAAILLVGAAQAMPLAGRQSSGVLFDRVEARRYCWRADGPSGPVRRCREIGDDYCRRWFDGSEEHRGGRRNIHGHHWRGTNELGRPAAAALWFQDGARGDASAARERPKRRSLSVGPWRRRSRPACRLDQ